MTAIPSQRSWLFRYKLYHIPFWMLYNYLLWALETGRPYDAAHTIFFSAFFIKYFFYVMSPALAAYFNLYFLIPRYLQQKRYVPYIAFLLLATAVAAVMVAPGYYLSAWLEGSNVRETYGIIPGWIGFYQLVKGNPLKFTLAAMTLAMSIKLSKNWIEAQRQHQELETEKLETEQKFLEFQRTIPAGAGTAGLLNHFFIKSAGKYEKVFFDDILYIEGMQNYVCIYTSKGKNITMLTLKQLEDKLAGNAFIRIHKSFIVPISKIDGLEGHTLLVGGGRIPVSRNCRDEVRRIVTQTLWNKK